MDELGIDHTYHSCEIDVRDEFDPVAYVLSINLHRRHLTTSQRAMIAARCKGVYEEEAKERQGARTDIKENLPECSKGQARDKAGKALAVSGKTVDAASKVLRSNKPEIIEAVDKGEMSVSKALDVIEPKPKPTKSESVIMQIRRLIPEVEDKLVLGVRCLMKWTNGKEMLCQLCGMIGETKQ